MSILGCNPYPTPTWTDRDVMQSYKKRRHIYICFQLTLVAVCTREFWLHWGVSPDSNQVFFSSVFKLRKHAYDRGGQGCAASVKIFQCFLKKKNPAVKTCFTWHWLTDVNSSRPQLLFAVDQEATDLFTDMFQGYSKDILWVGYHFNFSH